MDFTTIYITLGSNCNFKCSYCMQRYGIQKEIFSNENFDKIKLFLEKTDVKKIMLWGGEPSYIKYFFMSFINLGICILYQLPSKSLPGQITNCFYRLSFRIDDLNLARVACDNFYICHRYHTLNSIDPH